MPRRKSTGQQWSGEHAPPTLHSSPRASISSDHLRLRSRLRRDSNQIVETGMRNHLFFPHVPAERSEGLRELRLSEQLIQRKFAAPSFAYGAI